MQCKSREQSAYLLPLLLNVTVTFGGSVTRQLVFLNRDQQLYHWDVPGANWEVQTGHRAGALRRPRVGMVTPGTIFTQCEILPQKDRAILRARPDVRGEQASLCQVPQGDEASLAQAAHRGGLCSLSRRVVACSILHGGNPPLEHSTSPSSWLQGWAKWRDLLLGPAGICTEKASSRTYCSH